MSDLDVDVLVIGAGIQGAGAAQAAAAAGHRVAILEQTAPAAGTSSRSSKLIHGGLRYLETAQFSLVRESLHEREILLRIAPDLVSLVPFHVPIYRETTRRPWQIRIGLSLYAVLEGLNTHARFGSLPRREWDGLDGLKTAGLQAVFRYLDGHTDDAALTRAVVASALSLGAQLICPARLVSAERTADGYAVRFLEGATERHARCRVLLNAAGPWANLVLDVVSPAPSRMGITLVQGTHLLIAGTLERGVYYTEAPQDRRAVFVMPWKQDGRACILLGTTETPYTGDPGRVAPLEEERAYLRQVLAFDFPGRADAAEIGSFAGLRVLPEGPGQAFGRPREVILHPDDPRDPKLVTIYGGKLTGYRATAAKLMTQLAGVLPARKAVADTSRLMLKPA